MTDVFTAPITVDGVIARPRPIWTEEGVWTFGAMASDEFNADILLNGQSTGFQGHCLFVAEGCQLYLRGDTQWWLRAGGQFVAQDPPFPPPEPPVPVAVIFPAVVKIG
jgi:hypothetical protein